MSQRKLACEYDLNIIMSLASILSGYLSAIVAKSVGC